MESSGSHVSIAEPTAQPKQLRHLVVVDDHPLLAFGLKHQLERAGMIVDIVDPVGGNGSRPTDLQL